MNVLLTFWLLFLKYYYLNRYEASADTEKEVILDENDDLWVEMRHQVAQKARLLN